MTIGTWLVIIRARANDDPGLSWSTLLISFSFMYFHVLYSTIQRHDPSLPRGVHDSPPCAACWNPDWNPRSWRTQLSTVASVGTMSLWTASDLMKFSRLDLRKICRYLCHKFLGLQLAAPSLWWMLCRIMPLCRPLCHTYCDVFWGSASPTLPHPIHWRRVFLWGYLRAFRAGAEEATRLESHWKQTWKKLADIETKWNKTCQK